MAVRRNTKPLTGAKSESPADRDRKRRIRRAVKCLEDEQYQEAENRLEALLQDYPGHPDVQFTLARTYILTEKHNAAYYLLKDVVAARPEVAGVWSGLADVLHRINQAEAAAIAAERAFALAPGDFDMQCRLVEMLNLSGNYERGIALGKDLIARRPDNPRGYHSLGMLYQAVGAFDQARDVFLKGFAADPDYIDIHFRLAAMRVTAESPKATIKRLERLLKKGRRDRISRGKALFAIANIHEKSKSYGAAFEAYKTANETIKVPGAFQAEKLCKSVELYKTYFTKELYNHFGKAGSPSERPIFIVGMPRSGTTLTERIISAHPDVAPLGEFVAMAQSAAALKSIANEGARYPQDLALFEPKDFHALADHYLKSAAERIPESAKRTTDKLPGNTEHVGLIALLFPNAKIIHCRRDPIDTCLSCYFQFFASSIPFSTDLTDLGIAHRATEELMDHWKATVPVTIFDLHYEQMVADPEGTTRALIDFIGLEWNDACLDHAGGAEAVKTASQWQVRQPIYKTSVQRWRHYEAHLGPLFESLGFDPDTLPNNS